jgi:hypothetical protein
MQPTKINEPDKAEPIKIRKLDKIETTSASSPNN